MKQIIRLTENDFKVLITNILNEVNYKGEELHGNNPEEMKEFKYEDPVFIRPNKTHQTIIMGGNPIGFLSTYSANAFDDIHETYFIPDVDYGMKNGKWIEFRKFVSYDDAFEYATNNYSEVARLYRDGDWD